MTMEGKFVRAAYNNEGYVIIGYQVANRSIGEEWMMIDLGTTVRDNTPEYTLTRDRSAVDIRRQERPARHHRGIPRPNLQALEQRARVQRDSINYFPPMATQACRIGFFADITSPAMAWDEVAVRTRGRAGPAVLPDSRRHQARQYFLNVKFEKSLIRVPFRILTERGRAVAGRQLRRHPQAGAGRVPAEEEVDLAFTVMNAVRLRRTSAIVMASQWLDVPIPVPPLFTQRRW